MPCDHARSGLQRHSRPRGFRYLVILVSALLWCQRSAFFLCQSTSGVSIFLVPALFWCQPFSGASAFLVTAVFWCQRFSSVLFRCRPFSGVSPFSVPALFWCQPFSGASPILGPALFWCQHCSGISIASALDLCFSHYSLCDEMRHCP